MSQCYIGDVLKTPCGDFLLSDSKQEIIEIDKCKRDISNHLQRFQLTKAGIVDEADLILCRAGKYFCELTLYIFFRVK